MKYKDLNNYRGGLFMSFTTSASPDDRYFTSAPVLEEQGDYARAVFLWYVRLPQPVHKSADYPGYLKYSCGIKNAEEYHRQMVREGDLVSATCKEGLPFLKLADLKSICKSLGIKQGGSKDEVVERLQQSASEEQLKPFFSEPVYKLSNEAEQFLKDNDDLIYLHKSNYLYFTYDEFMKQRKKGESLSDFIRRTCLEELKNRDSIHHDQYAGMLGKFLIDHGLKADGLDLMILSIYFLINDRRWVQQYAYRSREDLARLLDEKLYIGEGDLSLMRSLAPHYSRVSTRAEYGKFFPVTSPILSADSFQELMDTIVLSGTDMEPVNHYIADILKQLLDLD